MPVGTHPSLLVVGDGNTITMPSMARYGARRGEPIARIRAINNCRKVMYGGRVLKINYVHYRREDFPLGPSDTFFRDRVLSNVVPDEEARGVG
jgi:hypothetical protein